MSRKSWEKIRYTYIKGAMSKYGSKLRKMKITQASHFINIFTKIP